MAGVKVELWTGELVKKFRYGSRFLESIPDYSDKAENDVIHLVDVGADPGIIIGNIPSTGVPIVQRIDGDIPISLEPFHTHNTSVTDAELYAVSYDKIASVVSQHTDVLDEQTLQYAAHAVAPAQNTSTTLVLQTTGNPDPNNNGWNSCTLKDIINLSAQMTKMGIPAEGRVLILGPMHSAQLVGENVTLMNQVLTGNPAEPFYLYGFKTYLYGLNPTYNTNLEKNAYQSVAGPTDADSSIAFFAPRMFKARGSTKMYYAEAAKDPKFRQNVVGFTQRFITLPKKVEAMFALVSKV